MNRLEEFGECFAPVIAKRGSSATLRFLISLSPKLEEAVLSIPLSPEIENTISADEALKLRYQIYLNETKGGNDSNV